MVKNRKRKCPIGRILGKLDHIYEIAEEMTTEVGNRREPDLKELAIELKDIRYVRDVWVGNVNYFTDELESAIVTAMTGKQRDAA